ncbi:Hypothetical protein SRAE_2000387000 [Strongyloides ratti]|uniref:Uncharacterized protein n=1 Tax=Strongyloides ratti TaxID=34506 RepID=A0A090LNZ4_STRRB|nr:Hypothetical protein SRAE_2000387000 [Strongyloides ratti]CEF69220.1 Hypothetical protein SRAE_2000387000 [Strongyloides ratti]
MYTLKPNFSLDFTVIPAPVMYTLPSYYGDEITNLNTNSSSSDDKINYEIPEFVENEFISQQAKLIKDIIALKKNFDQLISKYASEPAKETVSKEIPDSKTKENQGKKEKQEKKEKVSSNNKDAPSKPVPKVFEYDTSLKDSAYIQRTDLKSSNPYCLPPTLIKFKEQKNVPKKNITVELSSTNSTWFDVLEAAAKKNNLPFDVKVIKNDKTTIPKASSEGVVAEGLVPVWKFLGSVMGIYSYDSDVFSNTIDKFLNLFAFQNSTKVSDDTWSKVGIFLGTYDTLSGSSDYSLADIIAYGEFLKNKKEYCNNIEIWANRVKSLI